MDRKKVVSLVVLANIILMGSIMGQSVGNTVSASESIRFSEQKYVTVTHKYPRPFYYLWNQNFNFDNIPDAVWHQEGGYAGYLYTKYAEWEITDTHYVVRYSGYLKKGNFAPMNVVSNDSLY